MKPSSRWILASKLGVVDAYCCMLCCFMCADALVELIVQAGAVETVVPLLSIAEKADPTVAAR
jgi:hypothetical protein